MSHSYPSDISREQFARILPMLESARRRTKPRTVDLYDVFCGVLYLLKGGCQWRMLPADFPDWRTCYKYFRQWSERPGPEQESLLEQVLKKSVGAARQSNGRTEQTSFCIVDSQSVKNTGSAGNKGYDAGKKVSGIKRHIAVDSQGLPHAIHVTTADVADRAGALAMFDRRRADLSRVQNVMVDGGYTGKPVPHRGGAALRGLQPALRAGLHPGDHQPALRRVDRGLRVREADRSPAGPSHPPRPHPGDERRQLPAQA